MPRMTNTFMTGGTHDPEEIVRSIKKGIWAVDFGGGQVDITNGQFVFQCTEAYLVENGKVGAPVKNATLIGHGPTVMNAISMVGNDFSRSTMASAPVASRGQSVPVGVGQPSLAHRQDHGWRRWRLSLFSPEHLHMKTASHAGGRFCFLCGVEGYFNGSLRRFLRMTSGLELVKGKAVSHAA